MRSGDWAGPAVADPDPCGSSDVDVALGPWLSVGLALGRGVDLTGLGVAFWPGLGVARGFGVALGVDRGVAFGVAFGDGVGVGVGGGGAVTTTSGGLTWVCSQTVPPVRAWKTYDHDPAGRVRFRW